MRRSYTSVTVQGRISNDHHEALSQHATDCGRTLGGEAKLWLQLGAMVVVLASLHTTGVEKYVDAAELAARRERVQADVIAQINRALPHNVSAQTLVESMLPAA